LILFFRAHHFMDCADGAVPARPDLRRRCAMRQIASQKTLVGAVPDALGCWFAAGRRRKASAPEEQGRKRLTGFHFRSCRSKATPRPFR
jgi:hypothetical protein